MPGSGARGVALSAWVELVSTGFDPQPGATAMAIAAKAIEYFGRGFGVNKGVARDCIIHFPIVSNPKNRIVAYAEACKCIEN